MRYTLIRSNRKTLSLELNREGELIARAPMRLSRAVIEAVIEKNAALIEKHRLKLAQRENSTPAEPTDEERREYIRRALKELPPLVSRYAAQMDVKPTGIRVTDAKTRWGSCSPKNSLCFSWRLMRMPEPFIEYVVVHELAHIRQKNHSPAFYAFVASILPDHKKRRALGKNGIG